MVEPYDEPDIANEDTIIRRINPVEHVVYDDNRKCYIISTKAVRPSSGPKDGMSIDILKLIVNAEVNPVEFVTSPVYTGSIQFTAAHIREQELSIGYDPVPE
ncbi:MAG: hypothetical protein WD185_02250, partial [Sneathiella sp.]